jgi:hypothetical protein
MAHNKVERCAEDQGVSEAGAGQPKKKGPDGTLFNLTGAPGEIRTPDLLVRSQTLYPTELRARCFGNLLRVEPGLYLFEGSNPLVISSQTVAEREGFEPSKGV